jgi:hypothetical protein
MSIPSPRDVIDAVDVIAPLIVAALVIRNDVVSVDDSDADDAIVDDFDHAHGKSFPFTSAATITGANTSTKLDHAAHGRRP